jgi:hypothetical protein
MPLGGVGFVVLRAGNSMDPLEEDEILSGDQPCNGFVSLLENKLGALPLPTLKPT